MSNKQYAITVFSISFGVTCLIWGVLMGVMAKDLAEQVRTLEKENRQLEQEIIDYKWVLSQTNQMYCVIEEEI